MFFSQIEKLSLSFLNTDPSFGENISVTPLDLADINCEVSNISSNQASSTDHVHDLSHSHFGTSEVFSPHQNQISRT